jgi:hypothetical protein
MLRALLARRDLQHSAHITLYRPRRCGSRLVYSRIKVVDDGRRPSDFAYPVIGRACLSRPARAMAEPAERRARPVSSCRRGVRGRGGAGRPRR